MVAVKNDLALIAGAVGPYHAVRPGLRVGQAVGANLQLALDMGKYVNSFSWRGDPALRAPPCEQISTTNGDIDKCHQLLLYFDS